MKIKFEKARAGYLMFIGEHQAGCLTKRVGEWVFDWSGPARAIPTGKFLKGKKLWPPDLRATKFNELKRLIREVLTPQITKGLHKILDDVAEQTKNQPKIDPEEMAALRRMLGQFNNSGIMGKGLKK